MPTRAARRRFPRPRVRRGALPPLNLTPPPDTRQPPTPAPHVHQGMRLAFLLPQMSCAQRHWFTHLPPSRSELPTLHHPAAQSRR